MSVIGLDIGNENCVIGVAKQRGIDVLLNEESNRETPAVVSFGEKQRFLGLAGAASATMNPKSTISQVKRMIGVKYRELEEDLRLLPFETSEGPDGGILIHVQYLNETHSFTPVQILAMLLAHLKQMSEKSLEMPIWDCVIGIPSYFTDLQRRAYLDAAEIAGLNPLRLMHDCTAIALGYGIYRTEFPSKGPSIVVFVDIGHCDTQVTVAAFRPGLMKILSHSFDRNLGGRNFDEVLFKYFATEFKQHYNIDVYSNTRASVRLRVACEKLKKVLSANPEAPLNIECLMDEKDVKGFIKREDFEKLSSDLFDRISYPCHKALRDSGLSVDKIHSVELIGSGSRIPAVKKILSSLFGTEPRRTLNASECVARGCALQCAMLSPIYRVKDYEVEDSHPFSIGISSDESPINTVSNGILFPKGRLFPSVKILRLHRTNTFHIEAFYADQNELPSGLSPTISNFTIGPFQVSDAEVKVKVKVQLDLHGIVMIESASLIEGCRDNSNAKNKAHSTFEHIEGDNHVSSDVANGASDSNNEDSNLSAKHTADDMREGKIRRQNIPVSVSVHGGMTRAELSEAQQKELQLTQQDIKMEQTQEKKNLLESYVYETRTKLFNTYRSFATESEREGISQNLQQTEDWLYEDGDDESETVYTEKLAHLIQLVDPIECRYRDQEARALETRRLLKCIEDYRKAVGSLPSDQKEAVVVECNKAEQWLSEKNQQQESMPKNADPVLWSSEIQKKADTLDAMCNHIMKSKASVAEPDEIMDDKNEEDDNMSVD
ncbi:heat shock 70 kDa protein 16 [Heracleum sosnowskyi]|uniref:Heat shock 70 kDa protein 16 n=1 Tax=Heracleum sosnowskyi TaxID=360622 RepID=A0AAD8MJN5_9APIA|nr:heat shock 70 kDa protein 16 [Heracleum sosnowskyi]